MWERMCLAHPSLFHAQPGSSTSTLRQTTLDSLLTLRILRACMTRSCQAPQHEVRHGPLDPGRRGGGQFLKSAKINSTGCENPGSFFLCGPGPRPEGERVPSGLPRISSPACGRRPEVPVVGTGSAKDPRRAIPPQNVVQDTQPQTAHDSVEDIVAALPQAFADPGKQQEGQYQGPHGKIQGERSEGAGFTLWSPRQIDGRNVGRDPP